MTLVIARRIGDEIRLISDTKVTDEGVLRQTPLQGTLKCIVVSPTCCVSFAGNVYTAERVLARLLETAIFSRTKLASHLLEQHREHGCRTDFIVATAGKAVSIDRISNGCLEEDLPSAWIGDAEAFAVYQANYHASLTRQSPSFDERFRIAAAMTDGLRAVIDDSHIESVGDFTVSVTSRPVQEDGFRYLSYAFASGFKTIANTTEETSITQTLGVEGGAYNYCILVPTASGVGALAVHVREARVGMLFYPARSWSSILFRNVDTRSFIEEIRTGFGIIVDGLRT